MKETMINIKVGDIICMITNVRTSDGTEIWRLKECPIQKIVQNSKGTKVYSKLFYAIDVEEIKYNTELLEDLSNKFVLVNEVFCLNDIIRQKCERWIKLENENIK